MSKLVEDFPPGICNIHSNEDANVAIQIFGRRFFADQVPLELLAEFFLLLISPKQIGNEPKFDSFLPDIDSLSNWPEGEALQYQSRARLNLKLFAFLGSSRLEKRHHTHRSHYKELWQGLKKKINHPDEEAQETTLILLSNLFLGFWGAGADRTWCAQSFLPFAEGLLSGEIIWSKTEAKKNLGINDWQDILQNFRKLFTQNQHRFLARGGELLYLQLCNSLGQSPESIESWLRLTKRRECLTSKECSPQLLHHELETAFKDFFARSPAEFNRLADFIDLEIDQDTAQISDLERHNSCGWCPAESWRESYLFAVELSRLFKAQLDIMETVELLQLGCALQLLRSLTAQCYRLSENLDSEDSGLDHRMLLTQADEKDIRRKEFSQESRIAICGEIQALIQSQTRKKNDAGSVPKNIDSQYGSGLYLRIAKKLGIIAPAQGPGARYILTERLLRYFVLTLVPAKHLSLDSFRKNIKLHFGFVFEEFELLESPAWKEKAETMKASYETPQFLERMLEASGVLIHLSDSCSLVKNPFYKELKK